MKNKLITLAVLAIALAAPTAAFAGNAGDTYQVNDTIKLDDKKPLPGIGHGGGSHKAPSRNQCPVIVYFDDASAQLLLTATATPTTVTYYIYRTDGSVALSGTPVFNGSEAFVDLRTLASGTYGLQLVVDNQNYYGLLDI